jgi:hypothetical protein
MAATSRAYTGDLEESTITRQPVWRATAWYSRLSAAW